MIRRQAFETVVGLEVHIQLNTASKMFCGCATTFGQEPNTQTCPVCLGFPGSLPVLNKNALEKGIAVSLALDCQVQEFIKFDRKNYFYPDLPKAYQISQYEKPIGLNGAITITLGEKSKKVQIKRVHLEEDAGKLIHDPIAKHSFVDYNRGGTPLLEIVSEPDIHSSEEAVEYLKELKLVIRHLDVSDCNMEEGSLRCDANISLRPRGQKTLGVKTEIKNMNSFRSVKLALAFEQKRQTKLLRDGKTIIQETRLWDETKAITHSMRSKEDAHDYRYFPDPDLVPLTLKKEYISRIEESLPELPRLKRERFQKQFGLQPKEIDVLLHDRDLCRFFEACVHSYPDAKKIYNWLTVEILGYVNDRKKCFSDINLPADELIKIIQYVSFGKLSNLAAKEALFAMLDENKDVDTIVTERGLTQVSNEDKLTALIEQVLQAHQKTVQDYLSGKENAAMFLVGQTMKLSKGKANPKVVKELILKRLKDVSV